MARQKVDTCERIPRGVLMNALNIDGQTDVSKPSTQVSPILK